MRPKTTWGSTAVRALHGVRIGKSTQALLWRWLVRNYHCARIQNGLRVYVMRWGTINLALVKLTMRPWWKRGIRTYWDAPWLLGSFQAIYHCIAKMNTFLCMGQLLLDGHHITLCNTGIDSRESPQHMQGSISGWSKLETKWSKKRLRLGWHLLRCWYLTYRFDGNICNVKLEAVLFWFFIWWWWHCGIMQPNTQSSTMPYCKVTMANKTCTRSNS